MAWISPVKHRSRPAHGGQSGVHGNRIPTRKRRSPIKTAFIGCFAFSAAFGASWLLLGPEDGLSHWEARDFSGAATNEMNPPTQRSAPASGRPVTTTDQQSPTVTAPPAQSSGSLSPGADPSFVSFHELRLPGESDAAGSVPPVEETPLEAAPAEAEAYPFYVAEKKWNADAQRYAFYRVGMDGTERVTRGGFRRYFLSENQIEYPIPESGCGPTALLNLYIWYSKFGLIKESTIDPDLERYKQRKFREIDQRIHEILGQTRSPERGTNRLEQVLALDELLRADADNPVRLHFEFKAPPLHYEDFIRISRNYRAGILTVLPKDPITGEIYGYHAVLAVRGDTSGTITLANWGTFTHGRLVMRPDGQWFIPRDPSEHEMRIVQFTTLIPFTPQG